MTRDGSAVGVGAVLPKVLERLLPAISVGLVVTLWLAVYRFTVFLPSPTEVAYSGADVIRDPATYAPVGSSLLRLVAGVGIGVVGALALSLQTIRSTLIDEMVRTYVRVAIVVPSLLLALLSLVIFGASSWGAILTVAILVFPFAAVPMLDGLRSLDARQLKVAKVYRFRRLQTLRHVAIPHMAPYLFSAVRNSHALGWKVLIVAEVFAVRSGIGQEFHRAYNLFDLARVIVWLVVFLVIIAGIEYGVLGVLERRVFRWRSGGERGTVVAPVGG